MPSLGQPSAAGRQGASSRERWHGSQVYTFVGAGIRTKTCSEPNSCEEIKGHEEKRVCFHTTGGGCDVSFICLGAGNSTIRYSPQGWARDRFGQPDESANGCRPAGRENRSGGPQYSGLRGEENDQCRGLLYYAWLDRSAHLLLLHPAGPHSVRHRRSSLPAFG